jgi:hypothetical protein
MQSSHVTINGGADLFSGGWTGDDVSSVLMRNSFKSSHTSGSLAICKHVSIQIRMGYP